MCCTQHKLKKKIQKNILIAGMPAVPNTQKVEQSYQCNSSPRICGTHDGKVQNGRTISTTISIVYYSVVLWETLLTGHAYIA